MANDNGSGTLTARRLTDIVDMLLRHRTELHARHVVHLWVFGSVARGDDCEDSDVDILIEIDPASNTSLTGFSHLRLDLIDMLGRKVDLAEWSTLRADIVDLVRKEAVAVF